MWIVKVEWCAVGDKDDIEAAGLKHAVERAAAGTNGESLGGVVPLEENLRRLALLVVIVHAFVFVELKLAVGSGIDVKVDELGLLLVAPLNLRTERNDGTFAYEDWHLLVWS